ncbi:MAG: hypothetical protein A2831_02775 [Candidatus Yanofskybacteria bacterium RIFCSPHIGHO2_01_FULL_44_17]|uniref:Proteasome subunit beta n=1 Tax=Candidatus Yanofskybacteria bacterium RIFCSPHIGHO2_01_FULL_44_17 TaxID=1802668 RepID=A0A1F8EUA7_9BACT|nr:MAG: hypothetical protein A2831_02775 [Candidatus Yanofskybacteria bacterium RIFCSPHIGHO2_01_FULL_44_17]
MFADKFIDSRFRQKSRLDPGQTSRHFENLAKNDSKIIRSNTTVFALTYGGGVLIAGDRRTSGGYFEIVSDSTVKVQQVSDYSAFAAAGFCNIISDLEDGLISMCRSFAELYGNELSPDGQANFLKSLLEPWWFMSVYTWYWAVGIPIIAAYDKVLEKPRIFVFDESGYYYEPEFFGGTGCGFDAIRGLVVDLWRPDMSEEMAVLIAMKAMLQSGKASSGVSDAVLHTPTIAIIDREGFRMLPDKFLEKVRGQLVKNTEGIK